MKDMKTLISGGTGLVGKELGKLLAAKDHEIFILTRKPEKARTQCPFPHTALSWSELEDYPELTELDHIINLAGANITERRWNRDFKNKIRRSRIETTKKLVTLANHRCSGLKSFVSTSAIGFYGNTGETPVNEDHPHASSFLANVCRDWESATETIQRGRTVIFRVGVVFSEKGGALAKIAPPIQSGAGGPLSGGKQFMSWIDIEDLVNMYVFALENPITGVFNAVAPNPVSNKYLTRAIGKHLKRKTFLNVPYISLRILMGELACYLVENQKISSQKIRKKGFAFIHPNVEDSIKKRVAKLGRMERRLIFEQWVPKTKEEVFSFFSEAGNLEKIVPKNFHFKVLSVSTKSMEKGTRLNYKLKINGIRVNWETLITQWNPPNDFADNQERGPYKKWYHLHFFKDLAGGTLMTDQVYLEIPLGVPGYAAAGWKVFRDVKKIFDYRSEIIDKMYIPHFS